MKTGYWFRGATEHVVFAVRGSCPKPTIALPTAFGYPRISEHSRKPEAFYQRYVERISPGPRLEMFSRTTREGWVVWGNQAPIEETEPVLERI
jgi:N6-adenosine-specific RNA methylase IME4